MKELGEILKKKRKTLGLDLDKVHRATKIQEKYIEAIEEGDGKAFSAEIYYKSFVRSYVKFLGLNGEDLLAQYEKRRCEKDKESKSEQNDKNGGKRPCASKPDKERKNDLKKLFVTLLIACSLCAGFLYLNKNIAVFTDNSAGDISALEQKKIRLRQMKENEKLLEPERAHTGENAAREENINGGTESSVMRRNSGDTAETLPASGSDAAASPDNSGQKQTLVIDAVENVWVKVDGDGKEAFQGTMVKGTKKIWTAEKEFTVKVGYTPGVDVYFNGIEIDVDKGAVQDVNTLVLKRQP